MIKQLKKELRKFQRPKKAQVIQRFFKTGKGEYAEGDKFLGLYTGETRKVAKKYKDLPLSSIKLLLGSVYHEERICAVMIMNMQFVKGAEREKAKVYQFYLDNIAGINNWDLVDGSADPIMGAYLYNQDDKSILYEFVKSKALWKRRIAIMATYYFIKKGKFEDTLKIAEILISDKTDLIQKAVGWMLREVGNRDRKVEEKFLRKHYKNMGRTCLRYAIEKFPEDLRKKYLLGMI
ncbi:DNA alkylation repair protein [Candidatus Woesebacteria bacterium]|nr:DNA alkylation repair protein [Candidatus Woesebacteria bacterium]